MGARSERAGPLGFGVCVKGMGARCFSMHPMVFRHTWEGAEGTSWWPRSYALQEMIVASRLGNAGLPCSTARFCFHLTTD